MITWHVHGGSIIFACLTDSDSRDVPPLLVQEAPDESVTAFKDSGWGHFNVSVENRVYDSYVYRSRLFVSTQIQGKYYSLAAFLEEEFIPTRVEFMSHVLPSVQQTLGLSTNILWYPIVDIPERYFEAVGGDTYPDWIGDDVTSFRYRVFNADTGRIGYVRVSRFVVVCVGMTRRVVQDMVNLVYERALYPQRQGGPAPLHGELERSMGEGLSQYTLPTELNIYLQSVAVVVAVNVAIIAGLLAISIPILTSVQTVYARIVGALATLGVAIVVTAGVNWYRRRRVS